MYIANGHQIFYLHPDDHTEELFVTIHPTKDCTLTPEEQATQLCSVMNGMIKGVVDVAVAQSQGDEVSLRRALGELYDWYERDGSVGGASEAFEKNRGVLDAAVAQSQGVSAEEIGHYAALCPPPAAVVGELRTELLAIRAKMSNLGAAEWRSQAATKPYLDWLDVRHETHDTRLSDASSFDEICKLCGATDIAGGGWGWLRMPCSAKKAQDERR